jgi:hypothetical protein
METIIARYVSILAETEARTAIRFRQASDIITVMIPTPLIGLPTSVRADLIHKATDTIKYVRGMAIDAGYRETHSYRNNDFSVEEEITFEK